MPSAYGGIRRGTGISRAGQYEKGQSRILGKEVYFIDYNDDVHNPASRANQKNIAMRMQQFFDNKLRARPHRIGWSRAFCIATRGAMGARGSRCRRLLSS